MLAKPGSWAKFGLEGWLAAAAKRLHDNVLAAALANKLARISWSVLYHDRAFERHFEPQPATSNGRTTVESLPARVCEVNRNGWYNVSPAHFRPGCTDGHKGLPHNKGEVRADNHDGPEFRLSREAG